MNVAECTHEFEQLQIRSGLKEELEQTMVGFLRGLNSRIVEKIEPYWTSEDVCKPAIKMEKYSTGKKVFNNSYPKPTVPSRSYSTPKR